MHAILELKSAIDCERLSTNCGPLSTEYFSENSPLEINQVPIDDKFIRNYFDLTVPYIKSGDLLFILVAKKHQYPLITEDKKQYKAAKKAGVATYNIKEYLDSQF